jgi:hypothetical protein
MDITTNELKGMKAKQLRRLVREAIQEVLNETTVPTTINYKNKNQPDKILDIDPSDTATINSLKQDPTIGSISIGAKKIKEGDIEEMARTPKGFRLADDNVDVAQYANKRVSGVSLQDIISYFRENPGADKKSLQSQFNFVRPQIANAVVNALLDANVLVKLGAGGEVEATPEPGEAAPTQASEPEDLFMGSAENPLAMYFDNVANDDGSEDFTDSTEPEAGELEKAEPVVSKMSDEDYEAFMKYDDLSQRLAATKSNIIKLKRRKGGSPGDLTDKPSTELVRLRDLKASLEDRINTLVAGSDYLKKKIEKQTGKAYVEPVVEPEETEEEPLDEWTIGKLQYYAGIKK